MKKLTEYISESFEMVNENKRDMLNIKINKVKNWLYGTDLRDYEFYKINESSDYVSALNIESVMNVSGFKFQDYKTLDKQAYDIKQSGVVEPSIWNLRLVGGSQKQQMPFVVIYIDPKTKLKIVYLVRKTLAKINDEKKAKTEKLNKPFMKKWLKNTFDNGLLEYKRDFKYTDDYADDYANDYGKSKDWFLISDKKIYEKILKDIDSQAYSFSGNRGDLQYGVYSSWESYNLREKEQKE